MQNKESLISAINQVIDNIREEKQNEKIDMELLVNNCIREFNTLDLPFYSIALDKTMNSVVVIEAPFLQSCSIEIVEKKDNPSEKLAILKVNKNIVRRIKLEDYTPDYMKQVVHALLDYLKRFIILKNRFNS